MKIFIAILGLGLLGVGCGAADKLDSKSGSSTGSDTQERAACFVKYKGRVLIHRGNAGLVDLPGGHIRKGETPAQTAERETEEELGVKVDSGRKRARAEITDIFDCTPNGFDYTGIGSDINDVDLLDLDEVKAAKWNIDSVKKAIIDLMS